MDLDPATTRPARHSPPVARWESLPRPSPVVPRAARSRSSQVPGAAAGGPAARPDGSPSTEGADGGLKPWLLLPRWSWFGGKLVSCGQQQRCQLADNRLPGNANNRFCWHRQAGVNLPPFPRVSFATFAAMTGIRHGCGSPVGQPSPITLGGADEAIGQTTGPGQQQGEQVTNGQHHSRRWALRHCRMQCHWTMASPQFRQQVLQQPGKTLIAEPAAGDLLPWPTGPEPWSGRQPSSQPHRAMPSMSPPSPCCRRAVSTRGDNRSSPLPLLSTRRGGAGDLLECMEEHDGSVLAAWPSGKAEDCKSFIPSSNLGAAFVDPGRGGAEAGSMAGWVTAVAAQTMVSAHCPRRWSNGLLRGTRAWVAGWPWQPMTAKSSSLPGLWKAIVLQSLPERTTTHRAHLSSKKSQC